MQVQELPLRVQSITAVRALPGIGTLGHGDVDYVKIPDRSGRDRELALGHQHRAGGGLNLGNRCWTRARWSQR